MNKIEFNKVTWYSKLAAVILFIFIIPWWTFYIGIQYEKTKEMLMNVSSGSDFKPVFHKTVEENCRINPFHGEPLPADILPDALDIRGGATCTYLVSKNMPPFKFELQSDMLNDSFNKIKISKKQDNGNYVFVQQLDLSLETESPLQGGYFFADDMNFDGYADIAIQTSCGATGNCMNEYFLYNPATGLFERNNTLSNIFNPVPDQKTKEITSHSVGGAAGMIYEDDTYSYIRGAYVLTRSVSQNQDPNDQTKFIKTISELKNGKMKVISIETVKSQF